MHRRSGDKQRERKALGVGSGFSFLASTSSSSSLLLPPFVSNLQSGSLFAFVHLWWWGWLSSRSVSIKRDSPICFAFCCCRVPPSITYHDEERLLVDLPPIRGHRTPLLALFPPRFIPGNIYPRREPGREERDRALRFKAARRERHK